MSLTINTPDAGPSGDPSNVDLLPFPTPEANAALMREAIPSSRIRPQEWEKHRETIKNMHASGHSMKEMKSFMELSHGFFASESQWKKKLLEWKLSRNLGKGVAKFVGKRALRRRNEQQKTTQFVYKGVTQPADKIERHIRDIEKSNDDVQAPSATGTTPDGLSYRTIMSPGLEFVTPHAQSHEALPPPIDHNAIGPLKMAFYEGKSVDQWVTNANEAKALVAEMRYMEAKPKLLASLDGLEALLGPDHARTIDLLTYFVEKAVSNEDFDEAANRLHKSHRNHSDRLGQTHVGTWRSLIRLGLYYSDRGQLNEAYHMLFNARLGLLAAFQNDPEQVLNHTQTVSKTIIKMHIAQNDFQTAEEELRLAIARAEAAGELHRSTTLDLKHELVHLYNNDEWKTLADHGQLPYPTRNRLEPLLLELTSSLSTRRALGQDIRTYLCSLEHLRTLYEDTFQHEKLPNLLTQMESFFTTFEPAMSSMRFDLILQGLKGIAISYQTLRQYANAEWWLLYRQEQITQAPSYGPMCFEAVCNQMQFAQLYAAQNKNEEKREALKQAKSLAHEILPPEHDFHEHVANLLSGSRTETERCHTCLVNEAGKAKQRGPAQRTNEWRRFRADSELPDADEESNEGEE